MKPATLDNLARFSVAAVAAGLVFALAGETRSAIVLCAIGVAVGMVATWHSPIEPWH